MLRKGLWLLAGLWFWLFSTTVWATSSTYSTSPWGAQVFYLFLQDLGYQTSRIFSSKEINPQTQMLILMGPNHGRQGDHLLDWVRDGHTLLLALPLLSDEVFCESFPFGSLLFERHRATASAKYLNHPDLKIRSSRCVMKATVGSTVLVGSQKDALVVDLTLGKGHLLILAQERVLSNSLLDEDDLAVLLRRWLSQRLPPRAKIAFLENQEGGEFWDMVQRTNLGLFVLHSLLWLLLFYWRISPRFGDATLPLTPTRRAFAQHARALGALYQRSGASIQVLAQQYQRILGQLLGEGHQLHGPQLHGPRFSAPVSLMTKGTKCQPKALALLIATRTGQNLATIEVLLTQVEKTIQDPKDQDDSDPKNIARHIFLSQRLAALRMKKRSGNKGLFRQD